MVIQRLSLHADCFQATPVRTAGTTRHKSPSKHVTAANTTSHQRVTKDTIAHINRVYLRQDLSCRLHKQFPTSGLFRHESIVNGSLRQKKPRKSQLQKNPPFSAPTSRFTADSCPTKARRFSQECRPNRASRVHPPLAIRARGIAAFRQHGHASTAKKSFGSYLVT